MVIARLIGFGLVIVGIAAGAAISLQPFLPTAVVSPMSLWALFALTFLAGVVLLTAGAPQKSVGRSLTTAGAVLLALALLSAAAILVANLNVVSAPETLSSWMVFLACVPLGLAALIVGRFLAKAPVQAV